MVGYLDFTSFSAEEENKLFFTAFSFMFWSKQLVKGNESM